MIIINQWGALIQSTHIISVTVKREADSPSVPANQPAQYCMVCQVVTGNYLTISAHHPEATARYLLRHLQNAWLLQRTQWTVTGALRDLADGKWLAEDRDDDIDTTEGNLQ